MHFFPGQKIVTADGVVREVTEMITPADGRSPMVVVEYGVRWIAENCRPATLDDMPVKDLLASALKELQHLSEHVEGPLPKAHLGSAIGRIVVAELKLYGRG